MRTQIALISEVDPSVAYCRQVASDVERGGADAHFYDTMLFQIEQTQGEKPNKQKHFKFGR